MLISSGNRFRKGDPAGPNPTPFTLTEDTVVTGGNFILCRVLDVGQLTIRGADHGDQGGAWALDIQGGNTRGLYVNGVKQDSFIWQDLQPVPKVRVLKKSLKRAGIQVWESWKIAVDVIQAGDPDMTLAQFAILYDIEDPYTRSGKLINIVDSVFPESSWPEIRDYVRGQSVLTLHGGRTHVSDEAT